MKDRLELRHGTGLKAGHRVRTPAEHRYVPSGSLAVLPSPRFWLVRQGLEGLEGTGCHSSVDSRNEGVRGSNPRVGFMGFAGKTCCVELFRECFGTFPCKYVFQCALRRDRYDGGRFARSRGSAATRAEARCLDQFTVSQRGSRARSLIMERGSRWFAAGTSARVGL